MQLKYVGPHDEVEVVDAGIVVKRDEPVNVGEGTGQVAGPIAERLLEQEGWQDADAVEADASEDEPALEEVRDTGLSFPPFPLADPNDEETV